MAEVKSENVKTAFTASAASICANAKWLAINTIGTVISIVNLLEGANHIFSQPVMAGLTLGSFGGVIAAYSSIKKQANLLQNKI